MISDTLVCIAYVVKYLVSLVSLKWISHNKK